MIIHILMLLLKIIGILLLSVVGLILLAVAIILIAPIRYRFSANYLENEQPEGRIKVTWLAHLLSIQIEYKEKQCIYFVKLFGRQLLPKKEGKESKREKKKEKPLPEMIGYLENPKEEEEKKETQSKEDSKLVKSEEKEEEDAQGKSLPIRIEETDRTKEKKRRSIRAAIKLRWTKIKQFFQRIPRKIKNIKQHIHGIKDKIQDYRQFYLDETTQLAWKKVKKLAKKTLVHTLPRKLNGMVHFGTDDPALTGQILGILSIGMPIYQEHLTIVPAFERSVFEIQASGKGRVQLGYYLYVLLAALLDKNIRTVIKIARKKFK